MSTTTVKAYRVKGNTNDVTECEACGRQELKGTVMLIELDPEGNEFGDVMYLGCQCAAHWAKRTQKVIRQEARKADAERKRAFLAEHDRLFCEYMARRDAWMRTNYGTDDMHQAAKQQGHPDSAAPFVRAYEAIETPPVLGKWW